LDWIVKKFSWGSVRKNRTTFDWLVRDQRAAGEVLISLKPYLRVKSNQAKIALRILDKKVEKFGDLIFIARLADALSRLNVRSKNRRKNHVSMIQKSFSSND
jgi:hypothetical protein